MTLKSRYSGLLQGRYSHSLLLFIDIGFLCNLRHRLVLIVLLNCLGQRPLLVVCLIVVWQSTRKVCLLAVSIHNNCACG
jgi:hypothetical protein